MPVAMASPPGVKWFCIRERAMTSASDTRTCRDYLSVAGA
jgi:hypothetical protein